jgi:hypothetical protein
MSGTIRLDNKNYRTMKFKEKNGRKPTKLETEYYEVYGKFPTIIEMRQYLEHPSIKAKDFEGPEKRIKRSREFLWQIKKYKK